MERKSEMKESCKNCIYLMKDKVFYEEGNPRGKLKCGCLCKNRTPAWIETVDDLEYVSCESYAKDRKPEQLSMFG